MSIRLAAVMGAACMVASAQPALAIPTRTPLASIPMVRIGDAAEQRMAQGSVTYEPAGVTAHYFRNASTSEPAQLQCASLAGAEDKVLNRMLDEPRPR